MSLNPNKVNWSKMVEELASFTSKTQLAGRIGVNPKEVGRWIKGEIKPQGHHAEALRKECGNYGLNPRKYEGWKPVYVFQNSFEQNTEDGPQWLPPEPSHDLPKIAAKLWEFTPDSPLGIPACVLTANSNWIVPFSTRGFDIFTYKTVRSGPLPPHPFPNLAYVPEVAIAQPAGAFPKGVHGAHDPPRGDVNTITLVNSFGMPSDDPTVWQADMENTKGRLRHAQVLIASVVGTADTDRELIADFVRVAELAAEIKPHAIELNFSCPNVYGREGSIYHDAGLAAQICKKVSASVRGIKLVVKIGYLAAEPLRSIFNAIYPHVDGIAGINTLSATVLSTGQRDEQLFPGIKRKTGGVSGVAIKNHSLSVVRRLRELADEKKPELMILGMGGVSELADVKQFIASGANCVQLCTAAMFNPLIAAEIRRQWSGQSERCKSRALVDSDVRFSDMNVALAFERALQAASENYWPAEDVLDCVQSRWVRPYKESVEAMRESAGAPIKARSEAPTVDKIKQWYAEQQHAKLARTKRV